MLMRIGLLIAIWLFVAGFGRISEPVSWWETLKSVFMSFIGVQKHKNRQRDFSQGNPIRFVIMGFVLTIIFVVSLIVVVNLILSSVD